MLPSGLQSSLAKIVIRLCVLLAAMAVVSRAQVLTTLHSFDGTDGHYPNALIKAGDGNFYGTSSGGGNNGGNCGSNGCGTVFKVTPSGTLTTLYNFCSQPNCADGFEPEAGVIQATDGYFYGTTASGGTNHGGTVFRITANGSLTTLYNFCSQSNCADGASPYAALVQASDGSFYGTTIAGGSGHFTGSGTVFKITPNGTLTTVYNFCSQSNCADGAGPYAALVQATDGNFYGVTHYGGTNQCSNGCGTVFMVTPSGMLSTLHDFTGYPSDGAYPYAGLVQATNGNFYGTTLAGGVGGNCPSPLASGCGTVFKILPSGTLTILHSFDNTDGDSPQTGVIQATDGNFYGTAFGEPYDGGGSPGTLFRITSGGTFNILYSFCAQNACADGLGPWGLVQAANGLFYGTTLLGGGSGNCLQGCGTFFRLVFAAGSPAQFVPTTPCRLVDTRQTGTPIQGGTAQSFNLPTLGNCGISPNAAAYSLNVTVVPHEPLGYLTVWPTGQNQPVVSTMNSLDGRTKANATIVPAGVDGAVSVFASNTTDLVLDIDGYFLTPGAQTYGFYPLAPCRVIDTRGPNSNLGGPFLTGGAERDFPILASSCIPANVYPQAYSFNVTVVPHAAGTALGYLTIWPQGETQPTVSTLNNPTATDVANAAIVPAGTNGGVAVFPSNDTDLVVDINGYFATPETGGLSLYPTAPCRVLDTRGGGSGNPIVGEYTVNVAGSVCSPPADAQAYVFNATVVPSGALGYLSLWPDGETQPVVSTLNALDGFITSNMGIVPTQNGSIDAYASNLTQLVLDISSYFAP